MNFVHRRSIGRSNMNIRNRRYPHSGAGLAGSARSTLVMVGLLSLVLASCGGAGSDSSLATTGSDGDSAEVVTEETDAGTTNNGDQVPDDWPSQSISIIVPYDAGGGSDLDVRTFSGVLSDELGVPIRVVNMGGEGGSEGTRFVANAAPDGYTIGYGTFGSYLSPSLFDDQGFDPLELEPIARFIDDGIAMIANKESGFETVSDVEEAVLANPGTVQFAQVGGCCGSSAFVNAQLVENHGWDWVPVPYEGGSSAATQAVMTGEVQVGMAGASTAMSLKDELNILAMSTEERGKAAPDQPTFVEQGYDVTFALWRGAYAPPGTPEPIIERLEAAFKVASEDESVIALQERLGQVPSFADAEEFARVVNDGWETFKPIADALPSE